MPLHVARRVLPSVCLVVLLSVVLIAAPQNGASGPVSLLVTVVAPAEAPVTDLTAKDFTVQDGPHQIDVDAAEHATTPLAIILIVENTQREESAAPRTQALRSSLHAFVNTIRAGTADTQIGLFTDAGASVPVMGLKASPADLDHAIDLLTTAKLRPGALIETIADAARVLREARATRRAIVTVDFSARDPAPMAALETVGTTVLRSSATLWSVSVSGPALGTPSREAVLDAVTTATGGARTMMVGAAGVERQLRAIANSLLSQYTLRFAVPQGDPKALRIQTPRGKALFAAVDVQ
jgi:hypothetical protein